MTLIPASGPPAPARAGAAVAAAESANVPPRWRRAGEIMGRGPPG